MRCLNIPRHKVSDWYRVAYPWIEQACERAGLNENPRRIWEKLLLGDDALLQIYVNDNGLPRGCMVIHLPLGESVVWVWAIGGDMNLRGNLPLLMTELRTVARLTRRTRIGGSGRRGWARIMPAHGIHPLAGHEGVFMGSA